MTRFILAGVALLPAITVMSEKRDLGDAISESMLTAHVQYLASDTLGGRGVGTEGIEKAAEYIAGRFAEYGLQPGGEEGSYFQDFEILGTSIASDLTVSDQPIQPLYGRDYGVLRTETAEASFGGQVVFAGYGITDPQRGYDDYAGLDVKDKVVLLFRYEPEGWSNPGAGPTVHARFSTKAELAREHGAVAVMFVNPPRADDDDLVPRSGESFCVPMVQITQKLCDLLLRAGGFPDVRTPHGWIADGMRVSGPLGDLRIQGRVTVTSRSYKTRNVIGILPGQGPLAEEYVGFGAHYDHLGTVPPTRRPVVGHTGGNPGDEIHNGADDNASGTAGIIELARALAAGPRPQRSGVFMAFSGEEVSLNGSRHFVEHPTVPLDRMVAMFNLDMIGRLESDPLEVSGTQTADEFEAILQRHASNMGLELRLSGGGTGPSDHTSFFNKQIPVLFFFTGLHADYHKPSDDAELVDYPGMGRVLRFVEAVASDVLVLSPRPVFKAVSGPATSGVALKVRMGIMPSYGDTAAKDTGWPIDGVSPDGPAARAGMKKGDRILKIADSPVHGIEDYMSALKDLEPGDSVSVTILREGEQLTLSVELEGR
jgi:hypothetical protein